MPGKRPQQPVTQKRKCGACGECCTAMGITELNKKAGDRCPHLVRVPTGGECCGIYETRPTSCRTFECYWLKGWATAADRPDKLGCVIAPTLYGAKIPSVYALESKPNALTRLSTLLRLAELEANVAVYHVPLGDKARVLRGPAALVQKIQQLAELALFREIEKM